MVILDQSKKTFEFKILNFMKDNPSKLPKIKAKERKKTLNLLVLKVSRRNHVIYCRYCFIIKVLSNNLLRTVKMYVYSYSIKFMLYHLIPNKFYIPLKNYPTKYYT